MTNDINAMSGTAPSGAAPAQEQARNSQNIRRPVDLKRSAGSSASGATPSARSVDAFAQILARLTGGLNGSLPLGLSNLLPIGQRSHLLPPRPLASSGAMSGEWDTNTTSIKDLPYADLLIPTARKHGVSPELVAAVVKAESGFNPLAQSHAGAKGLMQLMDGTARTMGLSDVFDPAQNLDGGVRFLGSLLQRYNGNTPLALAAYNAGPAAVDKYGGIPPYKETRDYVTRVISYLKSFGGSSLGSDSV